MGQEVSVIVIIYGKEKVISSSRMKKGDETRKERERRDKRMVKIEHRHGQ